MAYGNKTMQPLRIMCTNKRTSKYTDEEKASLRIYRILLC